MAPTGGGVLVAHAGARLHLEEGDEGLARLARQAAACQALE